MPPSAAAAAAKATVTCSSLIDHAGTGKPPSEPILCCDRAHPRTDLCYMRGDIRTSSSSHRTIHLHSVASHENNRSEKIRPYPRKWEKELMETVDELTLRRSPPRSSARCDVQHHVPGLVFSTGGYTGNVYHEFNDGLIPLYITAAAFGGEVVLVVAEYHEWWFAKYRRVLEKMSRYGVVDLRKEKKVHCFDEMIVGLKIHGELAIDAELMATGKGILDFHSLLNQAFDDLAPPTASATTLLPLTSARRRPKLVILVRNRSRRLLNLREILRLSRRAGFDAELLTPKRSTPLADIRRFLATSDAMLAVHGAAVTHFLFMNPGSVLIQVIPLGLDWPAETYYGEPARRLGLQYMAYNVTPSESSLSKVYGRGDPVLVDTAAVTRKGWEETKRVYMDKQDVEVDLTRFGKVLQEARARVMRSRGSI